MEVKAYASHNFPYLAFILKLTDIKQRSWSLDPKKRFWMAEAGAESI